VRESGVRYVGISPSLLGHVEVSEGVANHVLTLEEAKNLRRVLGIEIEVHEAELEQRRKDGVREYLGDFE
jgi:hypothetical protein